MKLNARFTFALSLPLICTVALTAISLMAQDTMKPTSSEQAAFDVIGISARTTNTTERGGGGEIPKIWQRLFMENVLNRIPDRSDDAIVAVYTNYAGDENADYTYVLGAKVKSGTKAPDGMVSVSIPAGKYDEFVSAKGPGPEVIPPLWMHVYSYFQTPGSPKRAFKSDFERYEGPMDPNAMQAHIYIGVK